MTEACAGVRGDLAAVRWYVVASDTALRVGGRAASGYWTPSANRIVLLKDITRDGAAVRHEMLHALVRARDHAGHPRGAFLERCGGVVGCGPECVADAGPAPAAPAGAARVVPSALAVTAEVTPAAPAASVDGGHFALTIRVRNPAPHAVVVVRPAGADPTDWPGGVPGYRWELRGPPGALVGGVTPADPAGVVFRAGEEKRYVLDLAVAADLRGFGRVAGTGVWWAGVAMPPGAYEFRVSYGARWSDAVGVAPRP
jgi:hypothetical protein